MEYKLLITCCLMFMSISCAQFNNDSNSDSLTESSMLTMRDFDAIPWAEFLKVNSSESLEAFSSKHKVYLHSNQMLKYIWKRAVANDSESEMYWRIFHHIGELVDAGDALIYDRFCWMLCKKDQLAFYKRYCKGDKLAFGLYRTACMYDPTSFDPDRDLLNFADVFRVMESAYYLIIDAKDLQEKSEQRNKDAAILKDWMEEFGYKGDTPHREK